MHFYLGLSYLRQIKVSLIYFPFPISKACFVKSREILLMFHKSEVGISIGNVWLIQIYIFMLKLPETNGKTYSDQGEINAGKPPV